MKRFIIVPIEGSERLGLFDNREQKVIGVISSEARWAEVNMEFTIEEWQWTRTSEVSEIELKCPVCGEYK